MSRHRRKRGGWTFLLWFEAVVALPRQQRQPKSANYPSVTQLQAKCSKSAKPPPAASHKEVTMAAQSRLIEAPVFGDLQTVLDATWTNHVVIPPSRVAVEASSSGMFDCSPTLWYFFAGQYRTFDSVAPAVAQSAAQSGACVGIAVFTEVFIDETDTLKFKRRKSLWRAVDADRAAVGKHLARHAESTFSKRFAYAAVRRSGALEDYPACLSLYWHGVWAVARWALATRGLAPRGDAVVVRTRPDVDVLSVPLDPTRLVALFRGAAHVIHGQESRGQGDILAVMDFRTYERDIALPMMASAKLDNTSQPFFAAMNVAQTPMDDLARELWDRAHSNAWGWGRSILNGIRPFLAPCMDRCICLDGSTRCGLDEVVCHADIIVSNAFCTMSMLRYPAKISFSATPIRLGTQLVALCAQCSSTSLNGNANFILQPEMPWQKDNNFLYAKQTMDFPEAPDAVALGRLFPAGCGGIKNGPGNRSLVSADQCRPAYYFFSLHVNEVRARHVSVDPPLERTMRTGNSKAMFMKGQYYHAVNPNYVWRDSMT